MAWQSPPTLPATALRLLSLCADEDYSVQELSRVVEADPAISSRLLRLANSAYYGFSSRIGTLDRAIVALGRVTVQALALGHSLLRVWEGRPLPAAAEGLWVHAYLCALGCRHLAHRVPKGDFHSAPDTLFLMGLLHDIGKILFLAQDPARYVEALEDPEERQALLAWEKETYGSDHAEAGGSALEAWHVPPEIAAVVRYHHQGGLRAELRPDWQILRVVDDLAGGAEPAEGDTALPRGLVEDLRPHMARFLDEARAFYEVLQ